ncbi:hypothetical protein [Flavobacterium sp.]|uniref:hypothetical protein n=1 Tax=Flavobacterium sp. TaxID=239 RepID=UPI0028BF015B|nr:hypothetical protein [Flavobacterium sp.]
MIFPCLKKFFVLTILFNVTIISAQSSESVKDAERFNSCKVILKDGTELNGYIASFLETARNIDYEDAWLTSAETTYNLIDSEFEFRKNLEDRSTLYKQKYVKEVTLYYGDVIKPKTYKVLDLKYLDDDGQLKKSYKTVWLPVLAKDEINIYSMIFWYRNSREKWNGDTKYYKKRRKMLTMTYLQNSKDDYVLSFANPFDDDLSSIFNRKKITADVLRHIFRDCPNFIEKVVTKDKFNKDLYTVDKAPYKEKIRKVESNDALSEPVKLLMIDEITTEMDNRSLLKLIEDYKSSCK